MVDGVSASGWNSTATSATVWTEAVAGTMNGITPNDVHVNSVQNAPSSRRGRLLTSTSSQSVIVNYTVVFETMMAAAYPDVLSAYYTLSQQLETAVVNGNFTLYMQTFARELGCTVLFNATSNTLFISQPSIYYASSTYPTGRPTIKAAASANTLSLGGVVGGSIAALIAVAVVGYGVYYYVTGKNKSSAFDKWNQHYADDDARSSHDSRREGSMGSASWGGEVVNSAFSTENPAFGRVAKRSSSSGSVPASLSMQSSSPSGSTSTSHGENTDGEFLKLALKRSSLIFGPGSGSSRGSSGSDGTSVSRASEGISFSTANPAFSGGNPAVPSSRRVSVGGVSGSGPRTPVDESTFSTDNPASKGAGSAGARGRATGGGFSSASRTLGSKKTSSGIDDLEL